MHRRNLTVVLVACAPSFSSWLQLLFVKTLIMAFTEDSLKAKLSSLNETQDAISTVGQWILFHR